MSGRIRKWMALSRPERRTLVSAASCLLAVRVLMAMAGATRTMRLLERKYSPGIDHDAARAAARAIQRIADALPMTVHCLDRAVALCWLLSSRGLSAALRIGVRKDGGSLAAHAWVEHDGEALPDGAAVQFGALHRPVAASGR